jgi:hypothetical protein
MIKFFSRKLRRPGRLSLALAVTGFALPWPGAAAGGPPPGTEKPPAVLALVIAHLGPEDRPVPRLVVFPEGDRGLVARRVKPGPDDDDQPIPRDRFQAMIKKLIDGPFDHPKSDPDTAPQAGSFGLTLVMPQGRNSTITLNPTHAAEVLGAILPTSPKGPLRDRLERRRNIAVENRNGDALKP